MVCLFHLALWKKENFSLLVSGGAYLGSDGVIQDDLYICLGRPKGLKFGKDTWRETPTLFKLTTFVSPRNLQ